MKSNNNNLLYNKGVYTNKGCKGKCEILYEKENLTNIHAHFTHNDTRKCSICEITIIHVDNNELKCRCCNQKLRIKPLAPIKDINERESKIKRI